MEQRVVTVIGGTGFVGRYVVSQLAAAGFAIRVVSRRPGAALALKTSGDVGQIVWVSGNITRPESLASTLKGSFAVVNLTGVLFEGGSQRFSSVHTTGAEKLAQMASQAGVKRFIHVSALGVDKAKGSAYARSKLLGEKAVLGAFPAAAILRPSVIFGAEDNFFNQFAAMPILPLIGGGKTRFQPVYVGDVARAVLHSLSDATTCGQTYELGGPHIYSFRELLEYVRTVTGKCQPLNPLPFALASLIGKSFDIACKILPFNPPITSDQVTLLKHDNVVSADAKTFMQLGITPTALEIIVPQYLARFKKARCSMTDMLKFVGTEQHYPAVAAASERKKDFNEIYGNFDPAAAAVQASRCSQCGVPFCQIHCPLSNNIPDWLKLTAEGRLEEAYAISSATNNFPEICGRICPQDRLCEGNCVIEKGFDAVTIGSVEKYLTETAFENGWVKPIHVTQENGLSIGIIGAGPAGLAAADMLRRKGYAVHVYDRYDRVGGLMIYGIPNFKLDKKIVQRRHQLLVDGGIQFNMNYDVKNIEELRAKHTAVLIATGVYKARDMDIPDMGLSGVVQGLPYLTASNRAGLGDKVKDAPSAEGKNVVVIGGGDTAMDCVRTAVRQGAKKVTCLYRRDRANMPGSLKEVKNAEEEGVEFMWLSAPKAFVGKKSIEQILVQKMRLTTHDAAGRQSVVPVEGETTAIACDLAIKALGFDAEDLPTMFAAPELKVSKYGTLDVNQKTFETSLGGVFAAGDIVHGASLVVWAIKDGRDATAAIHQKLMASKRRAA